ncbi:ATP synthase mitochondrial F1 complex assembly factor 1 isoform X1 [Neocloeon triangulifer]|uniref:ATP synthase mitochondrial F1 complex assembly factor 1 isoform X1 n=1 Tax=Neocloeon triangulifer TaxID=2078957 RepID=UPI00286F1CC9|nr:ATP synthase mitochondrial F1 complex assembly factor 1 isoform X1 [Neocloeon triangulifer]
MNCLRRVLLPVGKAIFYQNNLILSRNIMSTSRLAEKALENLQTNPYFDKYAKKIAVLQETSPEEFVARLEETALEKMKKKKEEEESRKCSTAASSGSKLQTDTLLQSKPKVVLFHWSKIIISNVLFNCKALSEVMKTELIEGKSADEIKKIWQQYYGIKDAVAAVIPPASFKEILENGKKHPLFLFPLPRSNGYEFIVTQFSGNEIHFTTLINYQTHKENSPECLTLIHYTDLMESKGIVLMRGEYDNNILNASEAQCLANQVQLYYGQPSESKKKLLETFTNNPTAFRHMDLVTELESLSLVG